jgi:Domain of unknown function (DUF4389)
VHEHPVGIVIPADLERGRLTVFFRLILAIPLVLWYIVWSIVAIVLGVVAWLTALALGRLPAWLHRFFCAYVRFTAHMYAYLLLVANPYPPFGGYAGDYAFDLRLPEVPAAQSRWRIFVRALLAVPALFVAGSLGGFTLGNSASNGTRSRSAGVQGIGLGTVCAILGWFASVFTGRMPRGLRDAAAFAIGYQAQVLAYLLLVTDVYPYADPTAMLAGLERPPQHEVHIVGESTDLRRSRLTVALRLPLAIPHLVWLLLWGIAATLAAILQWFVTLFRGRPAASLHRFLSRFVRYELHVYAFAGLVANPFPAFTGAAGVYPLDLVLPPPRAQNRWKTGFRLLLAIPAFAVSSALDGVLVVDAILMWFASLARGSAPEGLRNLSAYALRYSGQTGAYLFLITDAYPHASPLEGVCHEEEVSSVEPLDEAA